MTAHLLDGLMAFCQVAQRRSFTAAAADLRVTRSAISQTIRALELRVGTALFARTTRDVALTQAGEAFLASVQPAVDAIKVATDAIGAAAGRPAGLLRLNVPRLAVATAIAPLLPGFLSQYPAIQVEIFTDDRFANIVADGFDAGVRLGELIDKDMVSVRVTPPDRLIVVGAPTYLARHPAPKHPRDLAAHQCINFRQSSRGGLYRWEFENGDDDFDIAVQGNLIVNDTDAKLRAAMDGLGLAYELEAVVQPLIAAGALVPLLTNYAATTPGFFLYFPSRAQVSPKLRAFIDYVRKGGDVGRRA
jgi:DNA-binding transcriptional LysR family regulator